MKNLKYILLGLGVSGLVTSCADILEKEPIDIISENVVWNDARMAEGILDNILEEMMFMFSEAPYENGTGTHLWGMHDAITVSDEARHAFSWYGTHTTWGRGLINENGGFLEYWLYPTIRKANEMIENLQETEIDRATADQLIAKARWCRAMCYFAMVKRYGGVPLVLRAQSMDDSYEELYVKRDKEQAVYDFILNEMDEIATIMPDRDKGGYPCKWAAYALKSRAAMYAASIATWGEVQIDGLVGIPQSEAKRYWQACYDASDKLIKEGGYALYNKYPDDKVKNFRQLFLDEGNSESIMVMQFTGQDAVGRNHGWDMFTGPQGFVAWAGSSAAVYLDMVESFENIDGTPGTFDRAKYEKGLWTPEEIFANKEPRFFASIVTQSTPFQGSQVEYYKNLILPDGSKMTGVTNSYEGVSASGAGNVENGGVTGFSILKYIDESKVKPGNWSSETDWMIFRLGEIYLNQAEACIELGKTGEALNLVNTIRERAGVALLTSIDRDKVRHERKIELAFESHRWFDLRRWRIAEEAISKEFKGLCYDLDYNSYVQGTPKYKITVIDRVDGDNQKYFPKKMYYLPITKGRISNNPNLAPENPGY